MQRSSRWYNVHVLILMSIYMLLVIFEWPQVQSVSSLALKIALAVLPALPVLAVIVLMGVRMLRSDELEQRLHLIALGVATGVVSALSVMGAFLIAAHVIADGGQDLFWVFPALCIGYGLTRLALVRRYGGRGC